MEKANKKKGEGGDGRFAAWRAGGRFAAAPPRFPLLCFFLFLVVLDTPQFSLSLSSAGSNVYKGQASFLSILEGNALWECAIQ